LQSGLVIASFGRSYRVELPGGVLIECATRGKKSDIACGDRVNIRHSGDNSGVIESVLARATLLYRSDARRQKLIAANVTQVVIVVAPVPSFYEDLINRCLAACEHAGITPVIVLNKTDLPQSDSAWEALAVYRSLGYRMLRLSAKQDATPLSALLHQQTSVLVGQSGMGKSTIVNRLVPGAAMRVAETSIALDSGRHTTTGARLLHIDAESRLIDSPGLQSFGLHHLNAAETAMAFPEFRPDSAVFATACIEWSPAAPFNLPASMAASRHHVSPLIVHSSKNARAPTHDATTRAHSANRPGGTRT
jgi:ribosome biogenesis GTPase